MRPEACQYGPLPSAIPLRHRARREGTSSALLSRHTAWTVASRSQKRSLRHVFKKVFASVATQPAKPLLQRAGVTEMDSAASEYAMNFACANASLTKSLAVASCTSSAVPSAEEEPQKLWEVSNRAHGRAGDAR
jgi:hypothetical protein